MKVRGEVRVPGDKSISHRALICAALSPERWRIRNVLVAADTESTAGVLRSLGAEIPALGPDMSGRGAGLRGLRAPSAALDCGNSGTTARLMAGVVAAHDFVARFVGDASLSRRPMERVAEPLSAMGARIELSDGGRLPMTVHGASLSRIEWDTRSASAQVKSAVLFAGLVAAEPVTVNETRRSRDHTERMLSALGVPITVHGTRVTLQPVHELAAPDFLIPGDPSSAAYFAALAALAADGELAIPDVCVNGTRFAFFAALRAMGATVERDDRRQRDGEDVATLRVRPGRLGGITIGERDVPAMIDELPLLACVAARADGDTVITGAAELRVKESDRIAAVVSNLRALGADVEELPDGMRVVGGNASLRGRVLTHGDHRLAMAFGVLARLPGNDILIDDPDCVRVSYPGFWDDLDRAIAP